MENTWPVKSRAKSVKKLLALEKGVKIQQKIYAVQQG